MKTSRFANVRPCALGFAFFLLLVLSPALDGSALPQEQHAITDSKSYAKDSNLQGAGYHVCTDHGDRVFTDGGNDRAVEPRIFDVPALTPGVSAESRRAWTFLFYDDADFSNAYDPFWDFVNDAHTAVDLNILILRDRNDSEAELWRMNEYGNVRLLQKWGEVNMGHFTTLQRFIQYGKANCPADRYFLAMYDHGGGWMGACTDVTNKGFLSMRAIAQGIAGGGGVDILAFTAPCIMAAMESVYEVRACVDVYIGSEDLSGYIDWRGNMGDICNLLNNSAGLSNEDIGRRVIEIIENNPVWSADPEWIWATMSAMSTSAIKRVAQEFDVIADYLSTHTALFLDDLQWSRESTWSLGQGANYDTKTVDLYDFTLELSKRVNDPFLVQALENLRESLDEAVIADCHLSPSPSRHPHGLSVYFPRSDETYRDEYGEVLDMTEDTSWNDFLLAYFHYQKAPRGTVVGTVAAECPAPESPLEGVTVTACQAGTGDLLGAAVTGPDGSYRITDLVADHYVVKAFAPLGYSMASGGININLTGGTVSGADLSLLCTGESYNPSGLSYWRRALREAVGGGGQALLDASEICACLDAIESHFSSHGIAVYVPPAEVSCSEKLSLAASILHPTPPVKTDGNARSHLMALLLNVATGNMRTDDVISKDGATVSQAISYCSELLETRPVDCLVITNLINNGVVVPPGRIPLGTPHIAFAPPLQPEPADPPPGVIDPDLVPALTSSVSPNPFNPSTTISFNVPNTTRVTLAVYDITGRLVTTLLDQSMPVGMQRIVWDGRDAHGSQVGSGLYFYSVKTVDEVAVGKILLIK